MPTTEEGDAGDESPGPTNPDDVSWTGPDLRPHLPDEDALPEQGLRAAVNLLRNPDTSGAFVAADLNRSRQPEPVRETLRQLLAYPIKERQPRDAKSPTDHDYSTGVSGLAGRSAHSYADLSPKQRGVVEVAAKADTIVEKIDASGTEIPVSDICRRADKLGFPRPHESYPESVLSNHRDILADRRAVLTAREELAVETVLKERLDAVMNPDTDTAARELLEAAGWFLPDHNLDSLPPAERSDADDLHPPADEQEAARRALSIKQAAAAGRPVPWAPDAIDANDKRIETDGAAPLGDRCPKAIPAPWPLVRSVLAPSSTTNRTVRAGVPYAAVVNGRRSGFGVFVNLDADIYDVNGLLRTEQLPDAASDADFEKGDRVAVYLRDRSNTDAESPRDIDLEFILAPRTVAERYSPATAEAYAAAHYSILPGENGDEQTPAPAPDPEEGLEADPDEMLLDPPDEARVTADPTPHARRQYASRVRLPDGEQPELEAAWLRAESVDPEAFHEVDGDGGVPDAVRYDSELNVAIVRRGMKLKTVLHGFGFNHDRVAAVKQLGYDPKPGDGGFSVPTSDDSVRRAVRPVLNEHHQTETAATTDSRTRDPPGFIDEWPAPSPRPPATVGTATAAVRRLPRVERSGTAPAVRPLPQTPPGTGDLEPAVVRPAARTNEGSSEQKTAAPAAELLSFDRVREELRRLEDAGHDVTGINVDIGTEGAKLSISTEES